MVGFTVRKIVWGIVAVPVGLFVLIVAIGVVSTWNDRPNARAPLATPSEPKHIFPSTPATVAGAKAGAPIRPGPEDIIVFPNSNVVCLKQDDLQQVILSDTRGEETKVKALVPGPGNEGAPCFMVSPSKRLKVLSATYPDKVDPMGLLEVVGEGVTSSKGAWALSLGAEIVMARTPR